MRRTTVRLLEGLSVLLVVAIVMSPASASLGLRFEPYQDYFYGPGASSAIADVTGDGLNDVLLSTDGFDPPQELKLYVLPQLADGALGEAVRYDTHAPDGPQQMHIETADLNLDGRTDVAVATLAGVDIFYQTADGLLADAQLIPDTNGSVQVEKADMDADGRIDLVVGDTVRPGLVLLRNTIDGFVQSAIDLEAKREVEVGDLSGDGRPDIAYCDDEFGYCHQDVLFVSVQQEDGTFLERRYDLPYDPDDGYALEIADVTQDGRQDIVFAVCELVVLAQNEAGGLDPPTTPFPGSGCHEAIEVADLDGDGLTDVLVDTGEEVGVYLQQPDGSFSQRLDYPAGFSTHFVPDALTAGDFNGDGLPDVALAHHTDGLVALRQGTPELTVQVTDFSYEPSPARVRDLGMIRWDFIGPSTHTVTDRSGLDLFDSGPKAPGSWYVVTLTSAGKFAYGCEIHPSQMRGSVAYLMTVEPSTGTENTEFRVEWATARSPDPYVYDIQIKRPGEPSFVPWLSTRKRNGAFFPDAGVGEYSFRARLRNLVSEVASGYSPPTTIQVVA
jgi:plastocyanin